MCGHVVLIPGVGLLGWHELSDPFYGKSKHWVSEEWPGLLKVRRWGSGRGKRGTWASLLPFGQAHVGRKGRGRDAWPWGRLRAFIIMSPGVRWASLSIGSGTKEGELQSQIHILLTVQPGASYQTFLSLWFLICKLGLIAGPALWGRGGE